jgi:hypothetical protein
MPERLPVLSILSPLPNAVVGNAPFNVMGSVSVGSITEPVSIDSVTVEILGQPGAVHATLSYIPPSGNLPAQVTFKTIMQITGGQDPHSVIISVKSDAGLPVIGAVTVTVGPRLVPPSAWVDIRIAPVVFSRDPSLQLAQLVTDPGLKSLLATIAQKLANLQIVKDMIGYWIIVGPNLVAPTTDPSLLRIGFWIVPQNFAPPDLILPTSDFPLPQMTPEAAAGCFGLVQPLQQPSYVVNVDPAEFTAFTFALSVPTITIQLIVDMLLPTINAKTGKDDLTLNSVTVQTDSKNRLVGQVSASFLGIAVSGTVTETLGRSQQPGTQSEMAAVVSGSFSSELLEILSTLILGTGGATVGAGYIQEKVESTINNVLDALPMWIPFRNSALGSGSSPNLLQMEFPFPMLVLNFGSFGTNDSGITGTGTGGLADREQNMVVVNLSGPKSFPNYSPGTDGNYEVSLAAFEPDNNELTTQVSGGGLNTGGTVDIDPFSQKGTFSTDFLISSGSETFTVSVSGTETCATDSTQTLTASKSLSVHVAVAEDHKAEAASAPNANVRAAEDTGRIVA